MVKHVFSHTPSWFSAVVFGPATRGHGLQGCSWPHVHPPTHTRGIWVHCSVVWSRQELYLKDLGTHHVASCLDPEP
jgi:hypothetical protein